MKNILLLIDMQNGFARNEQTKILVQKVKSLLDSELFDVVVATRFINYDNSVYEELFNWCKLKDTEEIKIVEELRQHVDVVVDKTIYTCINSNFLQRVCQLNGGEYPEKLFIVGVDTDCCVLKTATDLFEHNIRPIILSNYCSSNGGGDSHRAGLLCLKRLIGSNQITDIEIRTKEDLLGI